MLALSMETDMRETALSTNPFDYVHVPVQRDTYHAFVAVLDDSEHAVAVIDRLLQDFWAERFERLDSLGHIQSSAFSHEDLLVQEKAWSAHFGDIDEGYRWDRVLLRNGTQLRSVYKGKAYIAQVRHSEIWYEGKSLTPSKFANLAAGNTIRNAWRDLSIKFPGQTWNEASTLRHDPPANAPYKREHLDAFADTVADFNEIDKAGAASND